MYRADVTQSQEPAAPNYGTLAKGAEAAAAGARIQAESTSNMLKMAENVASGYVEYDLAKTSLEAEQASQEFFTSNMAAEKAAGEMAMVSPNQTALNSNYQVINTYDSEIKRLKNAVEGGMSNEEYVSRVSALSRKAIAKYPGLADKIRERVGAITGLPYADQWAEMQFVRERFSKQKEAETYDPMKIVLKDIEAASGVGTFGSQEELFNLYKANRPEYDARIRSFNEHRAAKTGTEAVTNMVSGLHAQSDLEADKNRGAFVAMFNGHLGSNVTSTAVSNLENVYKPVLAMMAKGESISVNPVAFDVQIKMHNTTMKTNIENARVASLNELSKYFVNNPNITQTKRDALTKDINDAADLNMRLYADDKGVGLAAMSAIMVNYRDKTLKEQRELIDLAIKQQGAMQNNSLVMAYWAGGAQRENLKETNKSFYEFMVDQERILTENTQGIRRDTEGATRLNDVSRIIGEAQKSNGQAVTTTSDNPATTKAAHSVMQNNAETALEKAVVGKALTREESAMVSSTFTTNATTGANYRVLADRHIKLGEKIKLLPPEEQTLIKTNVSNGVRQGVTAITSVKDGLEAKYGVVLQLGVNDAGQIMAMPSGTGKKTINPYARGAKESVVTIPSANEQAAIKEFNAQTKALTSNITYSRAMLTGENPIAISNDFATIINNKQPYQGFFDSTPKYPKVGAANVRSENASTGVTTNTSNTSASEKWWK